MRLVLYKKVNPYLISLLSERKCRVVITALVVCRHYFSMSIKTARKKQEIPKETSLLLLFAAVELFICTYLLL